MHTKDEPPFLGTIEGEIADIFTTSAPWSATIIDTYIKQTVKAPVPELSIQQQRTPLNVTVVDIVDTYVEQSNNASIAIQAL